MPYRPTARTEARRQAGRERLLDAAHALVAEGGYAAASVGAVARRAGIGTGSVYTHFSSKAELLTEVFRRASEREVEATRGAAGLAGSAGERLAGIGEVFARRALRGRRLAWALLAEPVDPLVDAERLVFRRAYRDVVAGVLGDGVLAGELPAHDVELTAAALVGAIGEALVGPLSPVSPAVDPDRVVDALLAVCLRAAGAQPAAGAISSKPHQDDHEENADGRPDA